MNWWINTKVGSMCGICGFYHYTTGEPADELLLRAMLQSIYHRGPDDQGIYIDRDLALGIRRLSIIDLAGGKQPIYNEDRSIVVIFNGEIYNYRELTEDLRQRGHTFTTSSDTEVIVHLYEEYGKDCVQKLRGMFTFAIWDTSRRQLFMARDRLGIKRLYYAQIGDRLIFGSEIKAILQDPKLQVRLDVSALSNFLSLKYVPAPQTMFDGIYVLPPGHTLTCDGNGIAVRPYWDLSFAHDHDGHIPEEVYAEQLEQLLRESVQLHLVSDVPFGAFLSGGIDSSTIVALMSQFLNEPVKTFSVGFEEDGEGLSELPYARLVAQRYGTDHHEVFVGAQDFIDLAEKVAWHLDQPIADEAALANYMLADIASRKVKMVLTGEGGDELFAGYARYAGERMAPLFRILPQSLKSAGLSMSAYLPGLRRSKLALYALCQPDEVSRLTNWFPLFNTTVKAGLLSDALKETLADSTADQVFARYLDRADTSDPLHRMLYVDEHGRLIGGARAPVGSQTGRVRCYTSIQPQASAVNSKVPIEESKSAVASGRNY
jgi:asparagine synthase (glutamine-hydrolysing)